MTSGPKVIMDLKYKCAEKLENNCYHIDNVIYYEYQSELPIQLMQ